jgi:hypothetical protein
MKFTNKDLMPVSTLQYLLQKLASESNEVAHACIKGLEFGIDDPYPDGTSIHQKIQEEFNDALAVAEMLTDIGFPLTRDQVLIDAKKAKMDRMEDKAIVANVLAKAAQKLPKTAVRISISTMPPFNPLLPKYVIFPDNGLNLFRWGSRPINTAVDALENSLKGDLSLDQNSKVHVAWLIDEKFKNHELVQIGHIPIHYFSGAGLFDDVIILGYIDESGKLLSHVGSHLQRLV